MEHWFPAISYLLTFALLFLLCYRFAPWNKHSTYIAHSKESLFDRAYYLYPRGYDIFGSEITITSTPFLKNGKTNPSFTNALSDSATEYYLSNPNSRTVHIRSYEPIPFNLAPYLYFPYTKIDAYYVQVIPDMFTFSAYFNSDIEELIFPHDAPLCFSFENCNNLKRLVLKSTVPPAISFYHHDEPSIVRCHPDIALYVPYESLKKYQENLAYKKITVKYADGTISPIPIKPIEIPEGAEYLEDFDE